MSDYERHKGTVTITTKTVREALEENIDSVSSYHLVEGKLPEDDDDLIEIFDDTFYRGEYIYHKGKVWQVDDKELDPYDSYFEGTVLNPLTISYNMRFYNGGCGFTEALEDCIDNALQEGNKFE